MTSLHVVVSFRDRASRDWYIEMIEQLLTFHTSPHVLNTLRVDTHVTGLATSGLPSERLSNGTELDNGRFQSSESATQASVSSAKSDITSRSSAIVSRLTGRPDLPQIIRTETQVQSGVTALTVGIAACGPAEMMYDVRNAAAEAEMRILRGARGLKEVYLHTEPFS